MTRKDNILAELKTLNSSLANQAMPWMVPANYFDSLAETVLARIRAIESGETEYKPSFLEGLQSKMPFAIPEGYFDSLAGNTLQAINAAGLSATEELAVLSPLLSGLKKNMPYQVPAGYFEEAQSPVIHSKAKIISMTRRRSFRFAAAAMVAGLIITAGLIFGPGKNNSEKSIARFEQKIEKEIEKTSDKELDEFLQQFSDAGLTGEEKAYTTPGNGEAEEFLKDVPEEELKEFLEETAVSDATLNNESLIMN